MPGCIVFGCSTTSRNRSKDMALHVFPKSRQKIQDWLLSIGVVKELLDIQSTIILADHRGDEFFVCSLHFAPDQYELDLSWKTSHPYKSKRLKSDAVPTLFHNGMLMRTATRNLADRNIANIGPTAAGLQQFTQPVNKRLVHQCTQTNFSALKVDQGTDPVFTWTDLMSQMVALAKEKLVMKDQLIQVPEFVGETVEMYIDHNYSQLLLKEVVVNKAKPAELSKSTKPVILPELAKPPKPQLEPVWIDSEESDAGIRPLLKENRVKDHDYCPSVEDYSTETDGEDRSSDWYCTTDEESTAAAVLEEQQDVAAVECLMPVGLREDYTNNAEDEATSHWQHMNQVGPTQENVRLPECLGYGPVSVKREAPDVTDLQNVLQIEAEGCNKGLLSPRPSDSREIPARKFIRYLSSGTKINEVLGNVAVSCSREEQEEITTIGQGLGPPIEANRAGRFVILASGVQYRCTNCENTFTYYEPRNLRGAVRLPSCPNCGLIFCEKVPQIIDQTCSQCKERFQTKGELSKHRTATSHSPFWCAECERGFKTKTGLRWHKECRHSRSKQLKCKECGKCFGRKQSLTVHRRSHTKYSSENAAKLLKAQTPCKNYYQCSECSQAFNSAFHFLSHERCHTGERPFKCKQCKKRFKQKSHLLRHLLIHGIGKSFQCEVCEKGFTQLCNYVKHVELHKETNPSCSVCGQTFPTRLCLKRHERDEHSDGTVHKCDQCGKEFRLIHYYLKHQKTHLREGTT